MKPHTDGKSASTHTHVDDKGAKPEAASNDTHTDDKSASNDTHVDAKSASTHTHIDDKGVMPEAASNDTHVDEKRARRRRGPPGKPCTDHTGATFASQKARAEHWGLSAGTVHRRLACCGYTLERALTEPLDYNRGSVSALPIVFEGVEYESRIHACRRLGADFSAVYTRAASENLSFVDALAQVVAAKRAREIHAFGKVWPTVTALARARGLKPSTLRGALARQGDRSVEDVVRALQKRTGSTAGIRRKLAPLPGDPVLFGWRFASWSGLHAYWQPAPALPSWEKLRERVETHGPDVDLIFLHVLRLNAEDGNLTHDLRRADEAHAVDLTHRPVERVNPDAAERYSIPALLREFNLKGT